MQSIRLNDGQFTLMTNLISPIQLATFKDLWMPGRLPLVYTGQEGQYQTYSLTLQLIFDSKCYKFVYDKVCQGGSDIVKYFVEHTRLSVFLIVHKICTSHLHSERADFSPIPIIFRIVQVRRWERGRCFFFFLLLLGVFIFGMINTSNIFKTRYGYLSIGIRMLCVLV